jgi:tetratricopeptide (TPR) repeat protein
LKSTHYDQATASYSAGDYPQALKGYYQCLKEDWAAFEPGEAGLVYHRIGNCLIRMRNFNEAAISYQKALSDDDYPEKTGVYVNLGTTLNGLGDYEEAIACFNKALADTTYATPYRAHMGLGCAYARLGQHIEAGTAFRDAALDEDNPNPVKALMSLASTFMSLNRPEDAAEAYLAVLDFHADGAPAAEAWEGLGQAYVAAGRWEEAIAAFDGALAKGIATLSPEAQADRQIAQTALSAAAAFEAEVDTSAEPLSPPPLAPALDPFAGLDVSEQTGLPLAPSPASAGPEGGYGAAAIPHPEDTGFFTLSDADLIATGKRRLRKERKLRHTGLWVFLVLLVILIAALGTCVVAYTQGVGIPSQERVVTDFFVAHAASQPVDEYWIPTDEQGRVTLARLLDGVAPTADVQIVGIDSEAMSSRVLADARLAEGGTVHYRIDLARDALGWKISGIEMVFASTE